MAKFTVSYTPPEFPIVYKDGFDGVTIPAVFVGQNAYIDSKEYDKEAFKAYDTNNYGTGVDWEDTYRAFKQQSAHPGIVAVMKAAYEAAIDASEKAGTATAGTAEMSLDGINGPTIAFYKKAMEDAGYKVVLSE